MSNPVAGTSSAPTFGGLNGYKRPALGRPTSVPSSLPAFRGRKNQPTDAVRTPAIQASKNQHHRPTNVTIPYARICPLDHLANVGRISPGDVVFTSRFRVAMHQVATQREQRIVGVDFLNKSLGNDDRLRPPGSTIHPNWVVGETVVLGGNGGGRNLGKLKLDDESRHDFLGGSVCDNWREASFLREWVCDGIVLSNDEPYSHTSNGQRDVQLFNICVQGRTACNNGYVDFLQKGVESYHRSETGRNGYTDAGEIGPRPHDFGTAIGGPYYSSYPLQMFDRRVKPLSNLFVGLVATKRPMNATIRQALLANSPKLKMGSIDHQKLTVADDDNIFQSFYTFHFVYFSDRAMWQSSIIVAGLQDKWALAEPPGKKSRPVHHDDRDNGTFDQFEPCSKADYEGMVGAWRIGKVIDTAARRKDQYMGGPVDTADQVTVNVSLEWIDWRVLRRVTERDDIGAAVSGAPRWFSSIPSRDDPLNRVDVDDGRTMQWPTEYTPLANNTILTDDQVSAKYRDNMPLDMTTMDTLKDVYTQATKEASTRIDGRDVDHQRNGYGQVFPPASRQRFDADGVLHDRSVFALRTVVKDQFAKYDDALKSSWFYGGSVSDRLGIQRRIETQRREDTSPALTADEFEEMWAPLVAMAKGSLPNISTFVNWMVRLNVDNPVELLFLKAIHGAHRLNAASWKDTLRGVREKEANFHFRKMLFFNTVKQTKKGVRLSTLLQKGAFERYIRAKENAIDKLTPKEVALLSGALEEGIRMIVNGWDDFDWDEDDDPMETAASLEPAAASASAAPVPAPAPNPKPTMDTGTGVGLNFGIAATPVAPPKPKAKASAVTPAVTPPAPARVAATAGSASAASAAPASAAPAAAARPGRPTTQRTQRAGVEGTAEIFSTIFGATGSTPAAGAEAAAPIGGDGSDSASDHQASPAPVGARSRVRRARDGR